MGLLDFDRHAGMQVNGQSQPTLSAELVEI